MEILKTFEMTLTTPNLDSSPISYSSSSILSKLETIVASGSQSKTLESDEEEPVVAKKFILDLNADHPVALPAKEGKLKKTRSVDFPTEFDKKLLEAIDYCGFGSWKNISSRISKNYSDDELNSETLPIDVRQPEQIKRYYLTIFIPHFKLLNDEATYEHTNTAEQKILDFHTINQTSELVIEPTSKEVLSSTQNHDIKYRRLRGDFDVEHDNTAEELVACLDDETSTNQLHYQELVPLRKALLDSYQKRLGERNRRKRFLQSNHSVDFSNKNRFSTILQLSTQNQLESLEQGLFLQKQLENRIKSLLSKKGTQKNSLSDNLLSSLEKKILPATLSSKKFTQLKMTHFFKLSKKTTDSIKSASTVKERKLVSTFVNEQGWKDKI